MKYVPGFCLLVLLLCRRDRRGSLAGIFYESSVAAEEGYEVGSDNSFCGVLAKATETQTMFLN